MSLSGGSKYQIYITGVEQNTSYSILYTVTGHFIFFNTEVRAESCFSSELGIDYGICFFCSFMCRRNTLKHYTGGLSRDVCALLPKFNHRFAQKEPSILNVLLQRVWMIFGWSDMAYDHPIHGLMKTLLF